MELSKSLSVPKIAPQNQIMVYQNTTIIVSQTFVTTKTINAPSNFNFLFIIAALLFLAMGFLLGIGAMFVCSRRKKLKAKNQKSNSIVLNESQKSTAESENSNVPIVKEFGNEARSSSTESSPALNSSSSDKANLQPLTLNNNSSSKLIENISDSKTLNAPEMRIVPFSNDIIEKDTLKDQDFSYTSNTSNENSKNSSEISSSKKGSLLQLKRQDQFSQNAQQTKISQIEKFGKIQLHQSSNDIHSFHEESDIQIHEDDGKIIKIEKTVNKTVYTEKKTEELKQLINNYTQALEINSNRGSPELILANQANRLALPACETDEMSSSDRITSPEEKILNKTSSPGLKPPANQARPLKRQFPPINSLEEEKCKEENRIELFSIQTTSIKSLQEKQAFPHLTGFFDKVFGDKTLIGRGGFGEVYKVTHKLEQKLYAVKKVKLLVGDGEDIRHNKFFREVSAMTSLHHPNIVRHHTTWTEEPPSSMSPQQIIRKSLSNRKLTMLKKNQESFSITADHTKISDLGFQWETSERQNSKTQKLEEDNDSDSEDISESFSRMKTISHIQASLIEDEEDKSDEAVLSALNASLINKLKDHQLIYLFMQMEYCSGDSLMNFLDNRRDYLTKSEIIQIFKQILEGVISVHHNGILHRDLKPSNIFFEKGFVKIGDFGLSWLGEQQDELETTLNLSSNKDLKSRRSQSYTSNIGTPFYISPEQEKSTTYDSKTDIYSLGIILFELVSNFTTRHERGEKIKALREKGFIDSQVQELFPDFSGLILRMTNKIPDERPSAKETLNILEKIVNSPKSLS